MYHPLFISSSLSLDDGQLFGLCLLSLHVTPDELTLNLKEMDHRLGLSNTKVQ